MVDIIAFHDATALVAVLRNLVQMYLLAIYSGGALRFDRTVWEIGGYKHV